MVVVREGMILCGEYVGLRIVVADDRDGETGGFYLYFLGEAGKGFDCWFECENGLYAQLAEFEVEWGGNQN